MATKAGSECRTTGRGRTLQLILATAASRGATTADADAQAFVY